MSLKSALRALPSLKGPFAEISLESLPLTPQEAFAHWLEEAIRAGVKEPHAMVLSTVDVDGFPDARALILKNVDERGWHFAVKASSPKGRQIDQNTGVALTFYWAAQGRQVRIRGDATKLPEEECAADFLSRPLASRASAMASKQSQVLANKHELQDSFVAATARMKQDPNFVSSDWAVYAVQPDVVEFWQGASDRLHQRLRYRKPTDNGWIREHLWP